MRIKAGDFTVGDIGVSVEITTDVDLTSVDADFVFIKPSGESIRRDATSVSTYTATYTWVAGDLDEAGEWRVWLYNETTDYFFKPSSNVFTVTDDPEDMARAR